MNTPPPSARTLGSETNGTALRVSALGLGGMGMSDFYGHTSPAGTQAEVDSLATIRRALDLDVTLLDTADMYGPFTRTPSSETGTST